MSLILVDFEAETHQPLFSTSSISVSESSPTSSSRERMIHATELSASLLQRAWSGLELWRSVASGNL